MSERPRPLDGVRVLELGQLIAGPFAATLLAWFGAEVIKVEPPGGGDPLRTWRHLEDGTSLWWRSYGRNKKCVTLDLRRPRGQELARRLALKCDVLLENFRPGTLERWGLGPDELRALHPELIYVRVSGYGQTGPYAGRPGFAAVCEAMGGLRHVTGYPDRPPVRPNLSLGDTLGGLHAALGALLALFHRQRRGGGQVVDVALYEAVFAMMESVLPEYDRAGVVRQREGTRLPGIVPSGIYPCADGEHVVIGGNGDSIFRRLMLAAGRPDLASDPGLAGNAGRAAHEALLDDAIAAWTRTLTLPEVLAALEAAEVPAGRIYDARAIAEDPHYRARGMFESVDVDGRPLTIPAMAPKLDATPGRTDWAGLAVGAHNAEVYQELLRLTPAEIEELRADGTL